MIKKVVGKCEYAASTSELNARSPGTKYRHYCPKTETALFSAGESDAAVSLYDRYVSEGKTAAIIATGEYAEKFSGRNFFDLGLTGGQMAARLYFYLRESEKYDILIGIRFTPCDEVALGVENRFLKAFGQGQ